MEMVEAAIGVTGTRVFLAQRGEKEDQTLEWLNETLSGTILLMQPTPQIVEYHVKDMMISLTFGASPGSGAEQKIWLSFTHDYFDNLILTDLEICLVEWSEEASVLWSKKVTHGGRLHYEVPFLNTFACVQFRRLVATDQ